MLKYKSSFVNWLVYAVLFFFLYDVIWILADFSDFIKKFSSEYKVLLIDFLQCCLLSLTVIYVNKWLFRSHRFKIGRHERKNFVWNGIVVLAANLLVTGVCELLLFVASPIFQTDDVWGTSFLLGIIASLVALINLSAYYSDIIIKREIENLTLQKKYLKLQLDPHFVFNSLSSLAGMIEEAPQQAEDYVVKLSHTYRYILRHIDCDYTFISEAADFIKMYVSMLNMRYDGNIELDIADLHTHEDECVLSLSLQLLIENAVKHNRPRCDAKLKISVLRHDDMLVIRNNRIYTDFNNDQSLDSYGIGTSNLQQRYGFESVRRPEIAVTRESFEVRLPILNRRQKQ